MDTPRNDGGARALLRLPVQYRNKPRWRGFISAFAQEAQEADAGLYTLWTGRQLATAAGAMLDVYGGLVGEERLGRADDSYRVAIRARMTINRGSGTGPELLRLLRLLAPEPLTLQLREYPPAGVVLTVSEDALPLAPAVHAAVQSARPAGVGLRLEYQGFPDAERFVTFGGVGLGFAGNATDVLGAREAVSAEGWWIPPTVDVTLGGSAGTPPKVVVTNVALVPPDFIGDIYLASLDPAPFSYWNWYGGPEDNGFGYGAELEMFPGGVPGLTLLFDENHNGGGVGDTGVSVEWTEGDPYAPGDTFFTSISRQVSTPPTLALAGPLAFTGRVLLEVVQGATGTPFAPEYVFRYTLGSQAPRTVPMARGTAVPLLLADGVTPSGLTATWPNVAGHYPGAAWKWQVVKANPVTGGRLTTVLGG